MSRHPLDWVIHAILCCIPVAFGWATWWVIAFVGIMIEYEQKSQVWYIGKSWKQYILKDSLGDLIADAIGIMVGLLIRQFILR